MPKTLTDDQIAELMKPIEDNKKIYESVSYKYDPQYNDMVASIKIVKEFIIEKGLIVYGGTAIDYALRLKGSQIYPDDLLLIPDLDFYSPRGVNDSYELAQRLYNAGFKESRVIQAQYYLTTKVDIANNHFIADISYMDEEIFKIIPTLIFDGMKFVNPIFQRSDIHKSLAFPFDNPPRENIFNRLNKDIKRFNIMDEYYPIVTTTKLNTKQFKPVVVEKEISKMYVFSRFAGYNLIYRSFDTLCKLAESKGFKNKKNSKIITCVIGDDFTFDSPDTFIDIVTHNKKIFLDSISLPDYKYTEYHPYINIIPAVITVENDSTHLRCQDIYGQLLSISFTTIDDVNIMVANIQYLLKDFIGMYLRNQSDETPLHYYNSLMEIIRAAEQMFKFLLGLVDLKSTPIIYKMINTSPFFPGISVYGSENMSISAMVNKRRTEIKLGLDLPAIILPSPLYDFANVKELPTFDYSRAPLLMENGKKYNEVTVRPVV